MTVNEFQFVPAQKTQRKARVACIGQAGSGKTMSALLMAQGFTATDVPPRIAVIDTEHGSASLYSDIVKFDVLRLTPPYTPARYRAACEAAVKAGYEVLVVDSMSQEWNGEGGILETVDQRKMQNQFTAWNGPSQDHEAFIQFVAALPVHVITTFRSKMAYAMSTDNGKTKVEKLGLEAITRGNAEYELDVVLEMTQDHRAVITKSRYPNFADRTILKPGVEEGRELFAWLSHGAPEALATPAPQASEGSTAPAGHTDSTPTGAKALGEVGPAAAAKTNGASGTGAAALAPQVVRDRIKGQISRLSPEAKRLLHEAGIGTVKDIETKLTAEVAIAVEAAQLEAIPA